MENSIFVGLSRQTALRANMNIIANNVANMSTPGYRAQNMVFTEFVVSDTKDVDDNLSMVLDYGHYQLTEPGPIQETGNPLDIALSGPGFIGIQTPDGIQYTRAGNFQMNVEGELMTGAGNLVAGSGGGTIAIPQNAKEIIFSEDGFISTENGVVGQILIAEFENLQDLEAMGNGLYKTDSAPLTPEKTVVKQGLLEKSNVKPVIEMTRMIDVLRAYQGTQRMLQSEHDRQRSMIQRLSRAN